MPKSIKTNFRQKYVEGIKNTIKERKITAQEIPDYCAVNYPYCSADFTVDTIESLKKTGELKVNEDGVLSIS